MIAVSDLTLAVFHARVTRKRHLIMFFRRLCTRVNLPELISPFLTGDLSPHDSILLPRYEQLSPSWGTKYKLTDI